MMGGMPRSYMSLFFNNDRLNASAIRVAQNGFKSRIGTGFKQFREMPSWPAMASSQAILAGSGLVLLLR